MDSSNPSETPKEPAAAPPRPKAGADSLRCVHEIISSGGRRKQIPIRNCFVRSTDPTIPPPLQNLVNAKSPIAIKLYIALIWRSSGGDYSTNFPARSWATLLDLDDPAKNGARRIRAALQVLVKHRLIKVTDVPGAQPVITVLSENGQGDDYEVPWKAYRADSKNRAAHQYFQIPFPLWEEGHIQRMKAADLAMLLILLEEARGKTGRQWWSVENFDERFGIRHDVRAAGTKGLLELGLLNIEREYVGPNPSAGVFTRDMRRRNTYLLQGAATPTPSD